MFRQLGAVCAVGAVVFGVLVAFNPTFADEGNTQGQLIAPGPPPLLPYEVATPSPGGGYIWVPGHWYYRPTGWAWGPGHWELAPYAGAVWVPGHWANRAYGWVWVPGHWQGYTAAGYPQTYVIAPPPPASQAEVVVAPPFVGAVWLGGFWRWSGRWVWVPGHWTPTPWRGAVWIPGRWARHPGGWVWIGGYWR